MPIVDVHLSKDDLNESEWETVIQSSPQKDCSDYSRLLMAKAREAKTAGDIKKEAVFRLLGQVASVMMRPDSVEKPFAPVMVMGNARSAILEDLSDSELDLLAEIVSDIPDDELKARIADVLWVRRRGFNFALLAINSYLESATLLEDLEHWTDCEDRIQRAFRLAVSLGPKAGQFDKVVSHIEAVLDKYHGEDPSFLSEKLMRLLLEYKKGDNIKYSALSEKLALRAESKGDWTLARACWETNARWYRAAGNTDCEKVALTQAAETYVKEAESASSAFAALFHMQRAIEAYRRVGGHGVRIEELHQWLLRIQEKTIAKMEAMPSKVDISDQIEKTIAEVKGKPLPESLIRLALMAMPVDVGRLMENVKKGFKEFPFQHLFDGTRVDEKGKVVARIPSPFSDDPSGVEAATQAAMCQDIQFHWNVCVDAVIEPARRQINLEHNVRLQHLEFIVHNNPMIPSEREQIYARGLLAGLQGYFLIAAHLLVPQFENSVRYVFTQCGVRTSGLNKDGIQEEFDLNKTLRMDKAKDIFGDDITFDLRALMVERLGANLRNCVAHGLMNEGTFNSVNIIYLWWLIFNICCQPIIRRIREQTQQGSESGTGNEE